MSFRKTVNEFNIMGSSVNSTFKFQNRKACPASNCRKTLPCYGSQLSTIDVLFFIAVVSDSMFFLYPYAKFMFLWLARIVGTIAYMVKVEIYEEPLIYGCVAIGVSCSALATWELVMHFTGQKCGDPRCRGLRNATEYDIQLETEECLKNSSSNEERARTTMFELPRDRYRGLEAELKKVARPNGRAVLLFRARCRCSVGKLVVLGPRRVRKIKK